MRIKTVDLWKWIGRFGGLASSGFGLAVVVDFILDNELLSNPKISVPLILLPVLPTAAVYGFRQWRKRRKPQVEVLTDVEFGSPRAQDDTQIPGMAGKLQRWFIEPDGFDDLEAGGITIVTGMKGAGKTLTTFLLRSALRSEMPAPDVVYVTMSDGPEDLLNLIRVNDRITVDTIAAVWRAAILGQLVEKDEESFLEGELGQFAGSVRQRLSDNPPDVGFGPEEQPVLGTLVSRGKPIWLFIDGIDRRWFIDSGGENSNIVVLALHTALAKLRIDLASRGTDFHHVIAVRTEYPGHGVGDDLPESDVLNLDRWSCGERFLQQMITKRVMPNGSFGEMWSCLVVKQIDGIDSWQYVLRLVQHRPRYLLFLLVKAKREAGDDLIGEKHLRIAAGALGEEVTKYLNEIFPSTVTVNLVERRERMLRCFKGGSDPFRSLFDVEIEDILQFLAWFGYLGVDGQFIFDVQNDEGEMRRTISRAVKDDATFEVHPLFDRPR